MLWLLLGAALLALIIMARKFERRMEDIFGLCRAHRRAVVAIRNAAAAEHVLR